MANSPTDKSKEFVNSGMTLITQPESDYWLKRARVIKENKRILEDRKAEWADGFVGK